MLKTRNFFSLETGEKLIIKIALLHTNIDFGHRFIYILVFYCSRQNNSSFILLDIIKFKRFTCKSKKKNCFLRRTYMCKVCRGYDTTQKLNGSLNYSTVFVMCGRSVIRNKCPTLAIVLPKRYRAARPRIIIFAFLSSNNARTHTRHNTHHQNSRTPRKSHMLDCGILKE